MTQYSKRTGELFILGTTVLEGLYPVIIHSATRFFPPFLFAGLSVLLAAVVHFFLALSLGAWRVRFTRRLIVCLLGVGFFIAVIPSAFIVSGTALTSGINTALLLQSEVPFALIVCVVIFGERLRTVQILGTLLVLAGTIFVLFQGTITLHLGDLLIILGTFPYVFGNRYAKEALESLHPTVVICIRSLIGGIGLLLLSAAFERGSWDSLAHHSDALWLIPAYCFFILVCSKLLWYQGLRRLSVMHAISLISATPAFGFLFAIFLGREHPTLFQLAGLALTILGLVLATSFASRGAKIAYTVSDVS